MPVSSVADRERPDEVLSSADVGWMPISTVKCRCEWRTTPGDWQLAKWQLTLVKESHSAMCKDCQQCVGRKSPVIFITIFLVTIIIIVQNAPKLQLSHVYCHFLTFILNLIVHSWKLVSHKLADWFLIDSLNVAEFVDIIQVSRLPKSFRFTNDEFNKSWEIILSQLYVGTSSHKCQSSLVIVKV